MKPRIKATIFTSALLLATTPAQLALADGGNGDRIYTAWAFVFNFAEYCDTGVSEPDGTPERGNPGCDGPDLGNPDVQGAVIYLTGQRVQSNGRAILAGPISAGSNHRQIGGSSMMGLVAPLTAEIHVGLQNHQKESLDEGVDRHAQATRPCPAPCVLEQAAVFQPGMGAGEQAGIVVGFGGGPPVRGASATMTRAESGVSISIDTTL